MPSIWQGIRNDIQTLEQTHAPAIQWAAKAESAETVQNEDSLRSLLAQAPLNLSASEQVTLQQRRRASAKTFHYGFEGNYHALVFFDDHDRPAQVIKW